MSEIATFGGGCFWCTEALIKQIPGVEDIIVGYSGGTVPKSLFSKLLPTPDVAAEAAQIKFNPDVISYDKLLDVFFMTHDPTSLNRQGADVGPQYRSEIFYHSEAQKTAAKNKIAAIGESKKYSDPVVTKISQFNDFTEAEEYHQNFYQKNPDHPFSVNVIVPKFKKLEEIKKDLELDNNPKK